MNCKQWAPWNGRPTDWGWAYRRGRGPILSPAKSTLKVLHVESDKKKPKVKKE